MPASTTWYEAFEDPKASFPLIQNAIYWTTDRTSIIECWFPKRNNNYRIIFILKLKNVTTRVTVSRSEFTFYSFFSLKCQSPLKTKAKNISYSIYSYLMSTQTSGSYFPKITSQFSLPSLRQDSRWILRVIIYKGKRQKTTNTHLLLFVGEIILLKVGAYLKGTKCLQKWKDYQMVIHSSNALVPCSKSRMLSKVFKLPMWIL